MEATTGWRFLVEELRRRVLLCIWPSRRRRASGVAGRSARRPIGPMHGICASCCRSGRVPESWIPPVHLLELRSKVRLRHTLGEQRSEWQQRIQAQLYHHGVPQRRQLLTRENRAWLGALELPEAARLQLTVALRDDRAAERRDRADRAGAARVRAPPAGLPGADAPLRDRRADRGHDPGRARRRAPLRLLAPGGPLRRARHHRHESDQRRAPGHLSRQGPPALRWALYEAAQVARRPSSPDRGYYEQARERLGGNRACLAIARKLLQRSYHSLNELGEEALQPA